MVPDGHHIQVGQVWGKVGFGGRPHSLFLDHWPASHPQVQEGQITHIQYEQGTPFLQESQVCYLEDQAELG